MFADFLEAILVTQEAPEVRLYVSEGKVILSGMVDSASQRSVVLFSGSRDRVPLIFESLVSLLLYGSSLLCEKVAQRTALDATEIIAVEFSLLKDLGITSSELIDLLTSGSGFGVKLREITREFIEGHITRQSALERIRSMIDDLRVKGGI